MEKTVTKPQMHLLFWSSITVLFFGFVWLFNDVLTPFVLAGAIAYLLNPVVNGLVKLKMPRFVAVSSILLSFFIFVLLVVIFAAPPLCVRHLRWQKKCQVMLISLLSMQALILQKRRNNLAVIILRAQKRSYNPMRARLCRLLAVSLAGWPRVVRRLLVL